MWGYSKDQENGSLSKSRCSSLRSFKISYSNSIDLLTLQLPVYQDPFSRNCKEKLEQNLTKSLPKICRANRKFNSLTTYFGATRGVGNNDDDDGS